MEATLETAACVLTVAERASQNAAQGNTGRQTQGEQLLQEKKTNRHLFLILLETLNQAGKRWKDDESCCLVAFFISCSYG